MSLVQNRLQSLDERDLAQQSWFIRASIATTIMGSEHATTQVGSQLVPSQNAVSTEHVLQVATDIGKRLYEIGVEDQEMVNWVGLSIVQEHMWSLTPAGMDLYNGLSGILLFFAYLDTVTQKEQYSGLIRKGLKAVQALKQATKSESPGAFDGLGGLIYLYSHLGTLWQEPALLEEAEGFAEELSQIIHKDDNYDFLSGAAGSLLVLLSLYAVHPQPRILEIALQCGDHLYTHAQPMEKGVAWVTATSNQFSDGKPLAGFSHGVAGIAYSLCKLAEVSGEERFRSTAFAALEYERHVFSDKDQNWPDFRNFEPTRVENDEEHFMTTWCHGAPGIGLGRLGMVRTDEDLSLLRHEIDIALNTTRTHGFGMNHSLCHGDIGNLDILLTAAEVLDSSMYQAHVQRLSAMIVESIETHGPLTGIPLGVETPGLMTGLAGIGYGLLRIAAPDKVPSILLLQPPHTEKKLSEA